MALPQDQLQLFKDDYRLIERVSSKARNIRIEVRTAREVRLTYPRFVPRSEALAFLRSREDWLRQKLQELGEAQAAAPQVQAPRWDGSDQLPLHGQMMTVKIATASLRRIAVRLEPEAITLFAPAALPHSRLELALRRELMRMAQADALRYLEEEAARLGVRYQSLRINDPRTLWGSCNPGGTICLSWRLLLAPPAVFRYVVIHELCHLVHANHSRRFWSLVQQQCADYETLRRWLREHGAGLHHYLPRNKNAGA